MIAIMSAKITVSDDVYCKVKILLQMSVFGNNNIQT